MVEWLVNNKLRRVWKETIMAEVWYSAGTCLETLMRSTETSVKMNGLWAEVSTWYL
jgi:hypothetical protein